MSIITLSPESLRSLKTSLHDRLPAVKSSHLTEALASALGFQSHAALRICMSNWPNAAYAATFDQAKLIARLKDFGNDLAGDFMLVGSPWAAGTVPVPAGFSALINRLRDLESQLKVDWNLVADLRTCCRALFAQHFGLGRAGNGVVLNACRIQYEGGVDYGACEPGWGELTKGHWFIQFPGLDHRVHFFEKLPLTNGEFVEYCTGIVSMPYAMKDGSLPELQSYDDFARRVGWTCTVLKDWSWYMAGRTTLFLYKRTTSHGEMLQDWDQSFLKWLIESDVASDARANPDTDKLIEDAITCANFPLKVRDFDELRELYFKEMAPFHPLSTGSNWQVQTYRKLFSAWQKHKELVRTAVA